MEEQTNSDIMQTDKAACSEGQTAGAADKAAKLTQRAKNSERIRALRKEFKGMVYAEAIKKTIRYIDTTMLKNTPNGRVPDKLLERLGVIEKKLRLSDERGYTQEEVAKKLGRNAKDVSEIENGKAAIRKPSTFLYYLEAFSILYNCSPLYFVKEGSSEDIYMDKTQKGWRELGTGMEFFANNRSGDYLNATMTNMFNSNLPSDAIELHDRLLGAFARMLKSRHTHLYDEIKKVITDYFRAKKMLTKESALRRQANELISVNPWFHDAKIGDRVERQYEALLKSLRMRQTASELFFRISQTDMATKKLICGWIEGELELRNIDTDWSKWQKGER